MVDRDANENVVQLQELRNAIDSSYSQIAFPASVNQRLTMSGDVEPLNVDVTAGGNVAVGLSPPAP